MKGRPNGDESSMDGDENSDDNDNPNSVSSISMSDLGHALTVLNHSTNDFETRFLTPLMLRIQYQWMETLENVVTMVPPIHLHDFMVVGTNETNTYLQVNCINNKDKDPKVLWGSQNAQHCVLIALAVYLETYLGTLEGSDAVCLFCYGENDEPDDIINVIYAALRQENLVAVEGTTSQSTINKPPTISEEVPKLAQSMVERKGMSPGRDTATARFAAAAATMSSQSLCPGGCIGYRQRLNNRITTQWLKEKVVPNMVASEEVDDSVALFLARPLLWAAVEPTMERSIPPMLGQRIRKHYRALSSLQQQGQSPLSPAINPIEKVPIKISNSAEGTLKIVDAPQQQEDDVNDDDNDEELSETRTKNFNAMKMDMDVDDDHNTSDDAADVSTLLRASMRQQTVMMKAFQSFQNEMTTSMNNLSKRLAKMEQQISNKTAFRPFSNETSSSSPRNSNNNDSNSNRLTAIFAKSATTKSQTTPQHRPPNLLPTNMASVDDRPAKLAPKIPNLHVLWAEYVEGLEGNRPGCAFTTKDKARKSRSFKRRNIFWSRVCQMVASGWGASDAIERIYEVCGRDVSIPEMLRRLKDDSYPELDVPPPSSRTKTTNNNASTDDDDLATPRQGLIKRKYIPLGRPDGPAELGKGHFDLYVLWDEWNYGLLGNKPAKEFTKAERKAVGKKYQLRNFCWSTVTRMVQNGWDAQEAIDRIYDEYGDVMSLSRILLKIRADKGKPFVTLSPPDATFVTSTANGDADDNADAHHQKNAKADGRQQDQKQSQTQSDDGGFYGPAALVRGQQLDLYELWEEYTHGLLGNKPARDFTKEEKAMTRRMYNQRDIFWRQVDDMCTQNGWEPIAAIDRIYEVYGTDTPANQIIGELSKDKRGGGNPSLLQPPPNTDDSAAASATMTTTSSSDAARTLPKQRLTAKLTRWPRSLYVLWKEYCEGVNGNKPVRDFSRVEQRAAGRMYIMRRNFWTKMESAVSHGWDAKTVIDRVYQVYGHRTALTTILKQMRVDKKNGGHPDLRILDRAPPSEPPAPAATPAAPPPSATPAAAAPSGSHQT